jgi:hypothetical protein
MNSSNAHHTSEAPSPGPALAVVDDLDDLVHLVEVTPDLYVRWSRGPEFDLETTSVDHLTGVELPGLSANPLAVEPWWGDRPARIWVARRLYDYRHLGEQPGVAPWLLVGEEVARGPDNEPVVRCHRPVARLGAGVIDEAERSVEQFSGNWGPLDRATSPRAADASG